MALPRKHQCSGPRMRDLGMTTFYCKGGDLFWDDWNWGSDAHARLRMAKLVRLFGQAKYAEERALGEECAQALEDYDAYWLEDDEQLRYETEMGS